MPAGEQRPALVEGNPNSAFTPDSGTTIIRDAQLDTTGGILTNGTNSFVVIYSIIKRSPPTQTWTPIMMVTLDLPSVARCSTGEDCSSRRHRRRCADCLFIGRR